jgi:hypothetical protein
MSVYIYDFESARWSRRADIPTPRSSFACCVSSSNGLVYVAGGLNEDIHPLAAEAYNVEEDKWEILPPMIQPHSKGCHGVFVEGKFMVISGGEFNLSAEIFDPRACLVASSSGELYGFNKEVVKKYDGEKRLWNVVASLPQSLTQFMCAAQSRDWIFLSGFVEYRKYVSYLFHPSSGQSIKINASDGGNYKGVILSAATVEI